MTNQTPRLLLILARNYYGMATIREPCLLVHNIQEQFVQHLRLCSYNLQRDNGTLFSRLRDRLVHAC